ncbi:carbohydrate ABC transporter permease [Fredinandcohnia onubensis]|uniref:carbohydrate ABC transporter permease n=1 Tax=Fredinandcohnia onubensis TaxID=1571209 RepID=UPI000C0C050E|nr:carbohydrate ABC transporter permease [Fredinandcohnia onubensis]
MSIGAIKKRSVHYGLNTITYVIVIGALFPLVWLLMTALKTGADAFAYPPVWFFEPTFENFQKVLSQPTFVKSYLNSLIVVLGTTFFSLFFGITSGYSLARNNTKIGNFMGLWIILARMAPPMGFALPLYIILRQIGLLNTHIALILVYMTITLPFITWLMMGFFKRIPIEIEEAARIDGCTRIQTLFRVVIPSSLPGIATCAIFSFIMSWNEFFYALIISGRETRPASVEIQGFISFEGINWGELAAASILVILPVLIFTMFAQKGLISGLTQGSSK